MNQGSIELFYENVEYQYKERSILNSWILKTLLLESKELHYINIIFCNDEYLLKINQDYLSHDYYTDIITFQYSNAPIEGELFISLDRVNENAINLGIDWISELHRVIIHGVLHLIGYGDKSDEEIKAMRGKENLYLAVLKDLNFS